MIRKLRWANKLGKISISKLHTLKVVSTLCAGCFKRKKRITDEALQNSSNCRSMELTTPNLLHICLKSLLPNNTQQEWGFVSLLSESQLSDCVFAFCTTNVGANKSTLTAKEVPLTPPPLQNTKIQSPKVMGSAHKDYSCNLPARGSQCRV